MSLYFDAATILSGESQQGSLKSRVYGNQSNLKSKPAHIYALITETAKYDDFLKEVIDSASILAQEPKLTPILSILLVHDHFFSKGGIAAPSGHPLRQAIERHKARLQAEFTKARLRRRCATVDALKRRLLEVRFKSGSLSSVQPRWIRVNTLLSTREEQLRVTFRDYKQCDSIAEIIQAQPSDKILYVDANIPDLLAVPPDANIIKSDAYRNGAIILQDKASCFPACLLLGSGDDGLAVPKDIMDACAAPGNKTTHLAALLAIRTARCSTGPKSKIFACERDPARSKTLQNMVDRAGAKSVIVLPKQDFLSLDPADARFKNVTHLVLDPSCSGSGILGREDIPELSLPTPPVANSLKAHGAESVGSKKRKHPSNKPSTATKPSAVPGSNSLTEEDEERREEFPDAERLQKLSNLQVRIVEHAFAFPTATHVTYSTCSVHCEENEAVVSRSLASIVAQSRGWQVLRRDEQVPGMRDWQIRGIRDLQRPLDEIQREACIRCKPGDAAGTMGFFVCGFVRENVADEALAESTHRKQAEEDAWEGFDG